MLKWMLFSAISLAAGQAVAQLRPVVATDVRVAPAGAPVAAVCRFPDDIYMLRPRILAGDEAGVQNALDALDCSLLLDGTKATVLHSYGDDIVYVAVNSLPGKPMPRLGLGGWMHVGTLVTSDGGALAGVMPNLVPGD